MRKKQSVSFHSLPIGGRGQNRGERSEFLSSPHAACSQQRLFSLSDHRPISLSQGSETVFRRRLCRSFSLGYGFNHHCQGRGRGFESRRPRHSFQEQSENSTGLHIYAICVTIYALCVIAQPWRLSSRRRGRDSLSRL